MKEIFEKAMLTGLGLAHATKEKLEEAADKIAKETKMTREEGKKFLEELIKKSDDMKKDFEGKTEKTVKSVLNKLNVPTQETIEDLKKRIDELEKLLKEKEKQEK